MTIISSSLPARPYRRIATEEAFSPPEMLEIYKRIWPKTMWMWASNTSWVLHEQSE